MRMVEGKVGVCPGKVGKSDHQVQHKKNGWTGNSFDHNKGKVIKTVLARPITILGMLEKKSVLSVKNGGVFTFEILGGLTDIRLEQS